MRFATRLALPLGLALACFIYWYRTSAPPPPTPPPVVIHPAIDGPRVWYPGPHFPSVALPDGRRAEVRSLLNVPRAMAYGEYVWNTDRIPPGRAWVRIDLDRQILSLFRGAHEIGSAVILFGTDGKPTPTGTFPILERATHHRSSLYDAEMPYMLRLTNDGVAIHASDVREGSATHGCIGVPPPFARLLFEQVRKGDLVSIVGNGTAPAATA